MSLLIYLADRDPKPFAAALQQVDPTLDIQIHPHETNRAAIRMAVTWAHAPGSLLHYPNLAVVASYGAGIDHIAADPELPKHVQVTRVVDEHLAAEMEQYVLGAALNFIQSSYAYRADQTHALWQPRPRRNGAHIGILGLGHLGARVGRAFARLGFPVSGWRRSLTSIDGVKTYAGNAGLCAMLPKVDILVNLLPLTSATRGILNAHLFNQLAPDAYLINVARGDHLNEADLLQALDDFRLSGACLDVFQQEPLHPDHSFWSHPRITVTPHVAARTNPKTVAAQIAANYRRLQSGEPLAHLVDPQDVRC